MNFDFPIEIIRTQRAKTASIETTFREGEDQDLTENIDLPAKSAAAVTGATIREGQGQDLTTTTDFRRVRAALHEMRSRLRRRFSLVDWTHPG